MNEGESLAATLEDVLADLPAGFVVAAAGDARLVLGPPGAFVLIPLPAGRQARDDAARRVHLLTHETRAALGEHLAWIPFLDALLVSTGPLVRGAGVTVAPVDLLGAVLRNGPSLIAEPTLRAIERVIGQGTLARWNRRPPDSPRRDPGTTDGRIELWNPLTFRAVSPH